MSDVPASPTNQWLAEFLRDAADMLGHDEDRRMMALAGERLLAVAAERDELRALMPWVQHKPGCPRFTFREFAAPGECLCGLSGTPWGMIDD